MTLKDAKLVKAGTQLQHAHIHDCVATATGPAVIDGLKWAIPVDIETSHRAQDGKYYITGIRGYCWKLKDNT